MRRLLATCLALALASEAAAQCPPDDAFEPDDTCFTASSVPGVPVFQQNGLVVSDLAANGSAAGAGDDWWRITVPSTHKLTIDMRFVAAGDPLSMSVSSGSCSILFGAPAVTNTPTGARFVYLNGGGAPVVVTLRVFAETLGGCNTYDLAVLNAPEPCLFGPDDGYEPNDDFSSPTPVSANSTTPDLSIVGWNVDVFSFDVPAGATQDVALRFVNQDADLDLEVWTITGALNLIATASSTTDDEFVSFTNASPGQQDYVVRVFRSTNSAGSCAPYDLELAIAAGPGSLEPYCFGDGSGTPCPCGNDSSAGHAGGCAHQDGDGAVLSGSGTPSVVVDGLHFELESAPHDSFAILVSGLNRLPQVGCVGCGIAAFDGLRCAGGDFRRHGSRATDAVGRANHGWGAPAGGLGAASSAIAGQSRHYFAFLRTNPTATCFEGQNSSNGVAVVWAP